MPAIGRDHYNNRLRVQPRAVLDNLRNAIREAVIVIVFFDNNDSCCAQRGLYPRDIQQSAILARMKHLLQRLTGIRRARRVDGGTETRDASAH